LIRRLCQTERPASHLHRLCHVVECAQRCLLFVQVPRHIQKQREEAGGQPGQPSPQHEHGLSIQTGHYDRNGAYADLEDEIWSPTDSTPIAQHFSNKNDLHHVTSPGWHNIPTSKPILEAFDQSKLMNSGAGFPPSVNHILIDPLLLGAGEVNHYQHPPMHAAIPRNEELIYTMNEMHLVPETGTPVTIPQEYSHMGYPLHYSVLRQSSPHSYGSGDTGSPQSGVSVTSSHQGIVPCRYPVLKPLLPHLGSIMSVSMACDLLEFYFQSSSSVFMEPVSPYILGTVFRKRSFLRQHKPRKCSPALLASMLWVAAQTSEASYLISSPSARGGICQKLWKLTVDLLKPLVHSNTGSHGFAPGSGGMVSPAAHDAFGVDRVIGQYDARMDTTMAPTSSLDDVATYLNLGVVTSASEYKAASLRWFFAAWSDELLLWAYANNTNLYVGH